MIRVCVISHSDQHGWHTSLAILCPSSVGSGAKPSGGRFCPQRAHLISSDMNSFHLGMDYSRVGFNKIRRRLGDDGCECFLVRKPIAIFRSLIFWLDVIVRPAHAKSRSGSTVHSSNHMESLRL